MAMAGFRAWWPTSSQVNVAAGQRLAHLLAPLVREIEHSVFFVGVPTDHRTVRAAVCRSDPALDPRLGGVTSVYEHPLPSDVCRRADVCLDSGDGLTGRRWQSVQLDRLPTPRPAICAHGWLAMARSRDAASLVMRTDRHLCVLDQAAGVVHDSLFEPLLRFNCRSSEPLHAEVAESR